MTQFTIWYRCNGRPSGTHSGFRTLERATSEARSAVFGVWTGADYAKITDENDRVVAVVE